MRYQGIVYRPPSEAGSLIIQLTIGCARNNCRFCYMYKDKSFYVRSLNEVIIDLEMAKETYSYPVRRIFLADGDALIVKTQDLLVILNKIKQLFPAIERVSAYGAPKDILGKSLQELEELRQAGLSMIYMGIESGDDIVLTDMCKGAVSEDIIQAGLKLKEAGMASSVTLISGLGGRRRLKEHALESARVISSIKPEYLGFLTLMVEEDAPLYNDIQSGKFPLLSPEEVVEEMRIFLEHIDSEGTVFRSNHASNYFSLAGTLNRDIPFMLSSLERFQQEQRYKCEENRLL